MMNEHEDENEHEQQHRHPHARANLFGCGDEKGTGIIRQDITGTINDTCRPQSPLTQFLDALSHMMIGQLPGG